MRGGDGDAVELAKQFSRKQEKLVKKILLEKEPKDLKFFKDLEDGITELDGETWTYQRHGAGVTFHSDAGVVINVHVGMAEIPDGLDAWRFLLYMESLGIRNVRFQGKVYSAGEELDDLSAVEELLRDMAKQGVLQARSAGRDLVQQLYVFSLKIETSPR